MNNLLIIICKNYNMSNNKEINYNKLVLIQITIEEIEHSRKTIILHLTAVKKNTSEKTMLKSLIFSR